MIKQAFLNIKSQKFIAIVILSSIIVGVASVYILFVVKQILAYQLKEQLAELGDNNFIATFIPDAGNMNFHPILQYEKLNNWIAQQKQYQVFPYSIVGSELLFETKKYPAMLLAVDNPDNIFKIKILYGRGLKAQDNDSKYTMIGHGLAQAISNTPKNLVGDYIQYQDQLFKIVGIYEQNGATLLDENLNYSALITYPLALRLTENIQLDHLYVQPTLNQNKSEILDKLSHFYHQYIALGSFHIKDADFILGRIKAQFSQIEFVLKWVCFACLGLGSLLLIQLFLLSLDKRKFEIGIRLACGASPKDIVVQFVQESCLYYFIGGSVGIFLGAVLILGWVFTHAVFWPFMALFTALLPVMFAIFLMACLIGLVPGLRSLSLPPMAFFKPGL